MSESLQDHLNRLAEKLKADTAERRKLDPRFDAECRMLATLEAQGFENVTRTAFVLKPDVTFSADAMVLETPHLAGYQLRVVTGTYSCVNASYADASDEDAIEAWTVRAIRQLMVAQRAEAQAWLEANPEEVRAIDYADSVEALEKS
jgi:hypothetical protein